MNAQQLPSTREEIIVHLVFSDGGTHDSWEIYSIALFPFVFGIPTGQVYLTASEAVMQRAATADLLRLQLESSDELLSTNRPPDDAEYFPAGYDSYLREICCSRGSSFKDMATIPPCSIRVITGHGFPMTRAYVMRTRTSDGVSHNIPFTDLPGPAPSILSIIDISGSQWGAAAAFGYFAANPNRKLKKRREKVAASDAPFACVNDDTTWAFRVGAAGDRLNPPSDEDALSKAFGDAVVCSVLAAAKDFTDNDLAGTDMGSLFVQKMSGLSTHYLDRNVPEKYVSNPKANLHRLQALMQHGLLELNQDAFNCSLFARQNEWFLTRARIRPSAMAEVSEGLSPILIDYVVVCLQAWYYSHRNAADRLELRTEKLWSRLSGLLGPGIYTTNVRLDWDEERNSLVRSDDGMPIEAWALPCRDLVRITHHVTNMIVNGSWDDEEGSSDEEEPPVQESTGTAGGVEERETCPPISPQLENF